MAEELTVIRREPGEVVLGVKGPNVQVRWVRIGFQYLLQVWNDGADTTQYIYMRW